MSRLWRHSRLDALLLLVTIAQLALNAWLAATWHQRSLGEVVPWWPVAVLLVWYNGVVATHNFLHTPWFFSAALNGIFAAVNTLNLGVPVTVCRFHHLNHHRYGNDRRGPDGRTRDLSSTHRWGKHGQPEGASTYCLLGLFRGGVVQAWRAAARGARWPLLRDLATLALGLAGYLALSWQYVLCFYLPAFYAGAVLGILTNYYQHAGAAGEDHRSNAVSHYGWLYNLLFCNEGYHQEHHLRPGLHWTLRPRARGELPAAGRMVADLPPVVGFVARPRRT